VLCWCCIIGMFHHSFVCCVGVAPLVCLFDFDFFYCFVFCLSFSIFAIVSPVLLFLATSYHHSPFSENMTRKVGFIYYKYCYNEDNNFVIGNNNTDVFRRFCVCFVDRCVCCCHFSFGHCAICPSSYGL